MITIEEKMKLFTKIVYDKIEKYNQNAVTSFNMEYGNLVEEKRTEFTKKAEQIYDQEIKDIQKQKLQILSKARVDEKKIILGKRKEIFDEMISALQEYSKRYVQSDDYCKVFFSDLEKVSAELINIQRIELIITNNDSLKLIEEIKIKLGSFDVQYKFDDEIIGGFILIDINNSLRIDMSIKSRIDDSREIIGEKLFEILH